MFDIIRCGRTPLYLETFVADRKNAFEKTLSGKTCIFYDMNTFFHEFADVEGKDYFSDMPAAALKALSDKKGILVLDFSGEGMRFVPEFAQKLHDWTSSKGVDPRLIYYCQQNYHWPVAYEAWGDVQKIPLDQRINTLFASAFMHRLLIEAKQQNLRDTAFRIFENESVRPKRFLCLNHSPTPHRVIVVRYLLERAGVNALCSLGLRKGSMDEEQSYSLMGRTYFSEPMLAKFPFYKEHTSLAEMSGRCLLPAPVRPMPNDFEPQLYQDTYCSIVNETHMFGDDPARFTEKSIKPFLFGQMAVFFGPPRLLSFLKSLGFETFNEFTDESYDSIVQPSKRIFAALNAVDNLNTLSADAFAELFMRTRPIRLKNLIFAHDHLLPAYEKWLTTELLRSFQNQSSYRVPNWIQLAA